MLEKSNDIVFNKVARFKISQGLNLVANIHRATLGFKDSISQTINEPYQDKFEKIGIELTKQLAEKINETCPDGFATATIMLDAIVKDGIKLLNKVNDPFLIAKALDYGLEFILEKINNLSYKITSEADLLKIALRYTKQNEQMAKTIVDSLQVASLNGIVILVNDQDLEKLTEDATCFSFNTGYASSYFCTDFKQKIIEFNSCDILILTKKVSSIQEILPLLSDRSFSSKELLIFAEDFEPDVIASLALNKLKKICKVAALKFSFQNKQLLYETLLVTNGKFINKNSILGSLKKAVISKHKTHIIPSKKLSQKSEFEKKAVLINCKNLKINDKKLLKKALELTKLSYHDKVVAGGGISLLFALQSLKKQTKNSNLSFRLFQNALYSPFQQLTNNANFEDTIILKKITDLGYPFGFNIENKKIENFIESNITDATKVIQNSLSYATSFAKTILLTDAIVINEGNY